MTRDDMSKYKTYCSQCGSPLTGYYQFSTCSACYSKNVAEEQRKRLVREKGGAA